MLVVWAFDLFLLGTIVLVGITQVAFPLWRGTPLFPFFRTEANLDRALSEAREKLRESRLQKEIEATRRAAKLPPDRGGDGQDNVVPDDVGDAKP